MWFNDSPARSRSTGSRRRRRRKATVRLGARVKSGRSKPHNPARLAWGLSAVVIGLVACVALWFGFRFLGSALFAKNDAFVIRRIDITGSAMITENLVREYTQVHEGMNLFALDIAQIRADFLRRTPNVKSMEISRILPHTLKMQVSERMPLAQLGWNGPLVVDRKGVVFVIKGRSSHLPVITGYQGTGRRPGSRLRGMARAALEVLDVCDDHPVLNLGIEAIEVDNRERLMLRMADRKSAKLAWEEMGQMTAASRETLLKRLGRLSEAIHSEKGRRHTMFDATMDGPIFCH